ncbi:MAG: 5'-3' exonuclease H3TH domain-containing protein [Candidatus Shapirobacteria bacterium]
MKRLVLIDGHAILHRAYHAFPLTLTTRKGELVNAVYGFTRILLSVIEELRPEYLAVTFDTGKPNFRHKEFVGYQVQRPHMDEELKDQIARVMQVVQSLNLPIFSLEGFEADDVIGTLAKQSKVETIIVTGDKDILQLVNSSTQVYMPGRGSGPATLYDEEKVKNFLGVLPTQIIDYKALVGDSSDNYPGVHGIGPKTATKLLSSYQNLDNIYTHLDDLEPLLRKKLIEGKEAAYLSQKLARIVIDSPVTLDLPACRVSDYDQTKVTQLFEELEFKSLLKKLPGVKAQDDKIKSEQIGLF